MWHTLLESIVICASLCLEISKALLSCLVLAFPKSSSALSLKIKVCSSFSVTLCQNWGVSPPRKEHPEQ